MRSHYNAKRLVSGREAALEPINQVAYLPSSRTPVTLPPPSAQLLQSSSNSQLPASVANLGTRQPNTNQNFYPPQQQQQQAQIYANNPNFQQQQQNFQNNPSNLINNTNNNINMRQMNTNNNINPNMYQQQAYTQQPNTRNINPNSNYVQY